MKKPKVWIYLRKERPPINVFVHVKQKSGVELEAVLLYSIEQNDVWWETREGNKIEYDEIAWWAQISLVMMRDAYENR